MKAVLKGPIRYVPERCMDKDTGWVLDEDIQDCYTGDEELYWDEENELFVMEDDEDVTFPIDSPFIEIIKD